MKLREILKIYWHPRAISVPIIIVHISTYASSGWALRNPCSYSRHISLRKRLRHLLKTVLSYIYLVPAEQ